jgi:hypothetical protein
MIDTARRKATWEACAVDSMLDCRNPFISEGAMLYDVDTSSTYGSSKDVRSDVIDISLWR